MRKVVFFSWLITAVAGCRVQAFAQNGEVTIYSHGSWTSELNYFSRKGIFHGGVWDGSDPLILIEGHVLPANNLYLTFSLPAGAHVLGIGIGRKPRRNSQMTLKVEAGQRYYIRVNGKQDIFGSDTSSFEVVSCQVAHGELQHGKLLDERMVAKEKRDLISADQQLAPCT